jgi:hypothetical protein
MKIVFKIPSIRPSTVLAPMDALSSLYPTGSLIATLSRRKKGGKNGQECMR